MNLKKFREERGYSQATIAKHLNISRTAVNKYENSGVNPPIDKLIALADLFNVSLDELVGRTPPTHQQSETRNLHPNIENAFIGMYGNEHYFLLSKSGQEKVSQYIDDLYGNPQYADASGNIVLRDPATGKAVIQTVAADPDEDAAAARISANIAAALDQEDKPQNEKKA